jgi:hypothetical protein
MFKKVVEEICKACTPQRVGDDSMEGDAKTSKKIYSETPTLGDTFFKRKDRDIDWGWCVLFFWMELRLKPGWGTLMNGKMICMCIELKRKINSCLFGARGELDGIPKSLWISC